MTSMCVEGVCRDPDEVDLRDDQPRAGFNMQGPPLKVTFGPEPTARVMAIISEGAILGDRVMHFRRKSQVTAEDSAIVQEAQAVLSGAVGTSAYVCWQRRPAWVYVNEFAHADGPSLEKLAKSRAHLHPATWDYARSVLAGEVLALASRGRGLVEVQRALVRLELELLDHPYSGALTPDNLVSLVTHALVAH